MVAANSEPPKKKGEQPSALLCAHCESPCDATHPILSKTQTFCCHGCRYVHDLIHAGGLERFYELRDQPVPPVQQTVFHTRDHAWFVEACLASKGRLWIEIQGLSCIGCIWLIKQVFQSTTGARNIQINPLSGVAELSIHPAEFPATQFSQKLQHLGYLTGPTSEHPTQKPDPLIRRIGLCGALAMNAMLFTVPSYCGIPIDDHFASWFEKGAFVCASLSMVIGGSHFFTKTFRALRCGLLHIDLPISLGLIAAYAGSLFEWVHGVRSGLYFDFVSVFTFLMLVGRWGHQRAVELNRKRLLSKGLQPPEPVSCESYEIPQGRPVPVRSRLLSSSADISLEWINGESAPRTLYSGASVPSGAVNLSQHPLRLVAKENWNDSLLHRLMHSERATPNADRLIHRFIVGYVGTVILLAIAGLLHALNSGAPVESALQIAISVLVVSCPCATGVALPLIHEIAAQRLRAQGVFIRDSSLWRRLLRVRRIAFDKTGTLTSETLRLASATTLTNLHPTALQALKMLVAESLHPVASAIRSAIGDPIAPQHDRERASEFIGLGLEWHDSTGTVWRLGKPVWALRQSSSTESRNEQGTVLSRNFLPVAAFHCDETLRSDAVEEIRHLSAAGIQCYILSGDEPPRVERIAKMLSLPPEAAQGNLSPDSKAQWLRNAHAREDTLMLGDGANDALAFNESLCCGTPAVDRGLLEQRCDFYLLGRGLRGVRALLEMARKQEIITRRVLVFAGLYNLAVIGLSLTGRMHPLLASLLMPASSIATLGIVLVAFGHAKSSKMSGGSAKMPRETRTQA